MRHTEEKTHCNCSATLLRVPICLTVGITGGHHTVSTAPFFFCADSVTLVRYWFAWWRAS